jgi:hypothetical protein
MATVFNTALSIIGLPKWNVTPVNPLWGTAVTGYKTQTGRPPITPTSKYY